MAMGVFLVDLMSTAVGDELEVAHGELSLEEPSAGVIRMAICAS